MAMRSGGITFGMILWLVAIVCAIGGSAGPLLFLIGLMAAQVVLSLLLGGGGEKP